MSEVNKHQQTSSESGAERRKGSKVRSAILVGAMALTGIGAFFASGNEGDSVPVYEPNKRDQAFDEIESFVSQSLEDGAFTSADAEAAVGLVATLADDLRLGAEYETPAEANEPVIDALRLIRDEVYGQDVTKATLESADIITRAQLVASSTLEEQEFPIDKLSSTELKLVAPNIAP